MINNIDPTAPCGGRPSDDKLPSVTPEKGFEAFYLAAEDMYETVFEKACVFPSKELQLKSHEEMLPEMLLLGLSKLEDSSDPTEKVDVVCKLFVTLLTIHIMRTEEGNFFKILSLAYDTSETRETASAVEAFLAIKNNEPAPLVASILADLFIKPGKLLTVLVGANQLLTRVFQPEGGAS